ncbi:hypothetical protein [Legionella sp. WA2022007384]
MKEKQESSTIEAPKKKSVHWNDGKTEGKVDESFLKVTTSASPTQEVLDKEIHELMKSGYSEIEASSIVGKPLTPSGKVLITEPVFYDSKDKIAERKFLEAQAKPINDQNSNTPQVNGAKTTSPENGAANRYNFFSPTVIGVGLALAVAASIGLSRNS